MSGVKESAGREGEGVTTNSKELNQLKFYMLKAVF